MVQIVKAMVFPVVMNRCENRTIKKAECQRTDAFEFWCWRRLLRVPWTARRSNQSTLKEISPEYSLEGLMLKLQYFGSSPDVKSRLIEKGLDAGKDWRWKVKRGAGGEMVRQHHWLNGPEFEQTLGDSEGQKSLACCSPRGHKRLEATWLFNNNSRCIYVSTTFSTRPILSFPLYVHRSDLYVCISVPSAEILSCFPATSP